MACPTCMAAPTAGQIAAGLGCSSKNKTLTVRAHDLLQAEADQRHAHILGQQLKVACRGGGQRNQPCEWVCKNACCISSGSSSKRPGSTRQAGRGLSWAGSVDGYATQPLQAIATLVEIGVVQHAGLKQGRHIPPVCSSALHRRRLMMSRLHIILRYLYARESETFTCAFNAMFPASTNAVMLSQAASWCA